MKEHSRAETDLVAGGKDESGVGIGIPFCFDVQHEVGGRQDFGVCGHRKNTCKTNVLFLLLLLAAAREGMPSPVISNRL